MSGSVLQFCNNAFWVTMMGTLTNGTCSTTGAIQYDATKNWLQACNGTNWKPLGNTTPTITTQTTVFDGVLPSNRTFATAAFSSAVGAGDAIICRFYKPTSTNVSTLTDNKGGTYSLVIAPFNDNLSSREELWVSQNSPGGAGLIVSGTGSAPGVSFFAECTDVKGVVATGVVDQSTKISGTTNTAAGTTVTTTSAREWIYIATFSNGSSGCGTASGWTTVSTYGADNSMGKVVSSLGSYTTNTAAGCGTAWTETVVTLRVK